MRKARLLTLSFLLVLASVTVALAAVGYKSNGVESGTITSIDVGSGVTTSFDGSTLTLTNNAATITSGTINGTTIGITTPAAAKFTTLTATGVITDSAVYTKTSSGYITRPVAVGVDGSFYGNRTSNMLIDGATIGSVTHGSGKFTTLTVTGVITDTAVYSRDSVSYPTRIITMGADGTIYGTSSGSAIQIDKANIGANTAGTGKFTTLRATGTATFDGVIVDAALYSKNAFAYPVHFAKVGTDGTIYGSGRETVIKELGIVSASPGVGAGRMLCVSTTDGAIYSIGAGSCF